MRAVAVTDLANMFGTVKHWKSSRAAGIQPIVGAELNVVRAAGAHADHLVVLAANDAGYANLIKLVSSGYGESPSGEPPRVTFDEVAASSRGLVALSGCLGGVAPQAI